MKKLIFSAAVGGAVLFLTGCQDTVNTLENADKEMRPAEIRDARFVTDSFLKRRLKLKSVRTGQTPDGFMTVQVEAYNDRTGFFSEWWTHLTGQNPYHIRYKFIWFDAAGMAVKDTVQTSWQDSVVKPGETLFLQSVAPVRGCRDFQLNLKEANASNDAI